MDQRGVVNPKFTVPVMRVMRQTWEITGNVERKLIGSFVEIFLFVIFLDGCS